MPFRVYHFEAFSLTPGKGNPAGVVFDAEPLSDATMQTIAARVGFNETAFVLPSDVADLRLRYFTPGHEINLCGHATIASLFALYRRGQIVAGELSVETHAGVLSMAVRGDEKSPFIEMTQAPAQFAPFNDDRDLLAKVLGISAVDLHPTLPIVYGSTGTWTLLVPVASIRAVRSMRPQNGAFPAVLTQMPRASIHPFCPEAEASDADLSARHFSSPYSGTTEDPITGTASGVMGAFMATHAPDWMADRQYNTIVEQGKDVGRDGRVQVRVINRQPPVQVRIGGSACYVGEIEVDRNGDKILHPNT